MVSYARKIFDSSPSYEDDRMLLKVMPLSGDIRSYFHSIRESDPGYLAKSRIRFLRGDGSYLNANAPFLGAPLSREGPRYQRV